MNSKTRQQYTREANQAFKEKVRLYKEKHPDMTMEAIGHVFKITKARVWQILQESKAA